MFSHGGPSNQWEDVENFFPYPLTYYKRRTVSAEGIVHGCDLNKLNVVQPKELQIRVYVALMDIKTGETHKRVTKKPTTMDSREDKPEAKLYSTSSHMVNWVIHPHQR